MYLLIFLIYELFQPKAKVFNDLSEIRVTDIKGKTEKTKYRHPT